MTNMAAIDPMTNMAAMPIYRIETLQNSFSLEWLITLKNGMLIHTTLVSSTCIPKMSSFTNFDTCFTLSIQLYFNEVIKCS